jgi:sugar phosphate isomerase/epimerase
MAMKIGIRTASLGPLGDDLPGALGVAGRLGYDGLEVVTRDPQQLRGWLEEEGPGGARAVRELAAGAGCAVSSFSLAIFRAVNFAQGDETLRRQGVALLSDALRACANVGGAAVLVPYFDRQRLDIDAAEEARFVDGLRACAPVAEATGVLIALETSFSAAQLRRIVGAAGSPRVGVYQDLANAVNFGQDPAATLRTLGPAVVMVHVKDADAGGRNAPLGEGVVDWGACREAVREIGYQGWFVLETPAGDDPLESGARHHAFTARWLAS